MKKILLVTTIIISAMMLSCGKKEINGHAYVDLGLPSGLKWATCNVGASSPEDFGNYFKWEKTTPEYDAATAQWGSSWRIPTKDEMYELVEYCKWEWTQLNGINGVKVIGPKGNSIFLPAAGDLYGSSLDHVGNSGNYWTSTPVEDNDNTAYLFFFDEGNGGLRIGYRFAGLTIRPVSE